MSFDDAIEPIIEAEGWHQNPETAVCSLMGLKGNVQWFPKDEHDEPFISIGWGWEGQTVRPKIEAVGKITMSYTKGQAKL